MKVWMNKRTGGYSGGMILVAANSKEEAQKMIECDEWLCYCYLPEKWEEKVGLCYNTEFPCIIDEDGYTE